ncbi:MAG: hypothetical protein DRQ60_03620 [Gammaproteobacteria bacterium]|nr:MAG: hypothetical protein DRQ60_03620 [Gammaproteobacteria bacterium]
MEGMIRVDLSANIRWFWLLALVAAGTALAGECDRAAEQPGWLFCDDFDSPPVTERYYSFGSEDGSFVWQGDAGVDGSGAMVATWQPGQTAAGGLQLLIGANPLAEPNIGSSSDQFRELYYRHYLWLDEGWQDNPYKLSRITVLTDANWSQAMIAHLWGAEGGKLAVDPVSCTTRIGVPICSGYNDFKNMRWLGNRRGATAVFTPRYSGQWHCVEANVMLNDGNANNGYQDFWLNGKREAAAQRLNFVGNYDEYGLNGLFIENWWNGGAPGVRTRVIDNLVVSTQRIGCAVEQN